MIIPHDQIKGRLDIYNLTSTIDELVDSILDGKSQLGSGSELKVDEGMNIEVSPTSIVNEMVLDKKRGEVLPMEDMMPPWGVAVLEGPSVESIRSWFFSSRNKGALLFHVPFDSFNPRDTPESRARFGVNVVQVASFIKGSAIASLRPARSGGRISSTILSERTRQDFLRLIAAQGFAWMEIEQDIEKNRRTELMDLARRSGSRIILSCILNEMIEWTPPEDIDLSQIDGYRIIVDVNNSKDLRRMIRASLNARRWAKGKRIIVEPTPSSEQFSRIFGPISLSDMVPWSISEIEDFFGTDKSIHGRNRQNIWRSMGIIGNDVSSEWSLWNRTMSPETKIYLQMGNVENQKFRSKLFNHQFNELSLDSMMVPWDSEGNNGANCLEMGRSMGVQGAIMEMPMRTQVMQHLDWIDARSKLVGGIDTISFRSSKAYGYNAEIYGIGDQITAEDITKGSKTLILGTGSSGRAAAIASRMTGMDTYISGNNKERTIEIASKLDKMIKGISFKSLFKPGMKFDLIINTIPFETRSVRGGTDQMMEIADLVKNMEPLYGMDMYHKLQWTPFLASIESRGGKPISGVETLISTSMRSFKLITGIDGSEDSIRKMILGSIQNS